MSSWQGKLLGGSLGSFFGPLGALAGATAGHYLVDRKARSPHQQAQRLIAVAAAAFHELANVDRRYTADEDNAIRRLLEEINHALGGALSPHELAYLLSDCTRIDRALDRLADHVRDHPDLARASVVWLWRIAVSDGDETPPEVERIGHYAHNARLPADELPHTSALYVRQSASSQERRAACQTLGLPYHADDAQVKAAYRTLSQTYHPDKHAGLAPAIRALTAEKFSQVKAAYDILHGKHWGDGFALAPSGRQVIPAAAAAEVRCFTCGRPQRLPAAEHIVSARCPCCQTLLAFERDLAAHLANG
jgi:DnaJ like chaperone protein